LIADGGVVKERKKKRDEQRKEKILRILCSLITIASI
jgi:hypothetical protein